MSRGYYPNIQLAETAYIRFSTQDTTGLSADPSVDGTAKIYKDGDVTARASQSGITYSTGVGAVGVHLITVDTSDTAVSDYYELGSVYSVVIEGATIGGVTPINHAVGSFAIGQLAGVADSAADNADVTALVNRALTLLGEQTITSLAQDNKRAMAANAVYTFARDSVLEQHGWKVARQLVALVEDLNTATVTNATWSSNTATITATAHGFAVSDRVTVTLVNTTGFNGTFEILTVADADTFTYSLTVDPGTYSNDAADIATTPVVPPYRWLRTFSLPSDFVRLIEVQGSVQNHEIQNSKLLTDLTTVNIDYVKRLTDVSTMSPMLREAIAAKVAFEISLRLANSNEKRELMNAHYMKTLSLARNIDASQRGADTTNSEQWLSARLSNDTRFRPISQATT